MIEKFGHLLKIEYGPSSCNPEMARNPGTVCTSDMVAWLKFDDEWIRFPHGNTSKLAHHLIACEDEIELLELINNWKDNE